MVFTKRKHELIFSVECNIESLAFETWLRRISRFCSQGYDNEILAYYFNTKLYFKWVFFLSKYLRIIV
jgi:hypothetical protein